MTTYTNTTTYGTKAPTAGEVSAAAAIYSALDRPKRPPGKPGVGR